MVDANSQFSLCALNLVNIVELWKLFFFFWKVKRYFRLKWRLIERGGPGCSGQSVYFWTVIVWSGKNINIDLLPVPSPEEIVEDSNTFELWTLLTRASRGPWARFYFQLLLKIIYLTFWVKRCLRLLYSLRTVWYSAILSPKIFSNSPNNYGINFYSPKLKWGDERGFFFLILLHCSQFSSFLTTIEKLNYHQPSARDSYSVDDKLHYPR